MTKAHEMLGCGVVVFLVVFVVGVQVGFGNPAVLGSVPALVAAVLWGILRPGPFPTFAAKSRARGMLGCGVVVFLVVFAAGVYVGFGNPAVLGSEIALVAAVLWGIFGPAPLPPSAAATPKNPTARSDPTVTRYKPRRAPIPRHVKEEVWRRDGGRCVECGSNYKLHFDHTIPYSWGGSDTVENLQILCQRCNLRKGNRHL